MSLPARSRGGQTILVVYVIHIAALSVLSTLQAGIRRRIDDRGALTTEQAIITAALIGLAGLLVIAITAAVNNKLPNIK